MIHEKEAGLTYYTPSLSCRPIACIHYSLKVWYASSIKDQKSTGRQPASWWT